MDTTTLNHLQQKSLQLYLKQLTDVFSKAGYTIPFIIRDGIDIEWNEVFVKELIVYVEKEYKTNLVPEIISFKKNRIDETDSEVNELFEYYKKKITSKTIKTKVSHQKIRRRLEEKPIEENTTRLKELKKSIDMFSKNIWRMNNNKNNGLQFFFRSEDQIVKWLSLSQDKGSSGVIIIGNKK